MMERFLKTKSSPVFSINYNPTTLDEQTLMNK